MGLVRSALDVHSLYRASPPTKTAKTARLHMKPSLTQKKIRNHPQQHTQQPTNTHTKTNNKNKQQQKNRPFKVWRLVYALLASGNTVISATALITFTLYIFACVGVEIITKEGEGLVRSEGWSFWGSFGQVGQAIGIGLRFRL